MLVSQLTVYMDPVYTADEVRLCDVVLAISRYIDQHYRSLVIINDEKKKSSQCVIKTGATQK